MPREPVFKLSCGIGEQDTCLLACCIFVAFSLDIARNSFIRRIFHQNPREVYTVKVRIILYVLYNSYIITVSSIAKILLF